MAWRNVWRNTRRSGVTIAAMTFSLLMMTCVTSFYEGMLIKMEAKITDVEIGDIQIHDPEYRNNPSLYNGMRHRERSHETLRASPMKRPSDS